MHILVIPFGRYVPGDTESTGFIFGYDQARALKKAGIKVGFISPDVFLLEAVKDLLRYRPQIKTEELEGGIPIYFFARNNSVITAMVPGKMKTLLWCLMGRILFERYIEENGLPDIIHAHNAFYAGIMARSIKKTYGVSYIITEHSSGYARGLVPQQAFTDIALAFSEADALIAVSPALGGLLRSMFGESVRSFHWVPNILDMKFGMDGGTPGVLRKEKDIFCFLHVGSFDENKGQLFLLKAFAEKFRGDHSVTLRIVGHGPMRCELERATRELGIEEQVFFLGRLRRSNVLDEMRHCDTLVHSSIYETFGVVLIEALACGKPVISTASGGPECIVSAEDGLLVPPMDAAALGDAMERMRKEISRYASTRIRENCISRFGEGAVVSSLEKIYKSVIRSNRHAIL